jgi:hypothetical protein
MERTILTGWNLDRDEGSISADWFVSLIRVLDSGRVPTAAMIHEGKFDDAI